MHADLDTVSYQWEIGKWRAVLVLLDWHQTDFVTLPHTLVISQYRVQSWCRLGCALAGARCASRAASAACICWAAAKAAASSGFMFQPADWHVVSTTDQQMQCNKNVAEKATAYSVTCVAPSVSTPGKHSHNVQFLKVACTGILRMASKRL